MTDYIDRIKSENFIDYVFLCAAAHEYQETKSETALKEVKRLLDKHNVGYIDDLTGDN